MSAFIDRSIEYYDDTFRPHPRGLDQWEVREKVFRRNLSAVKRHVIDAAPTLFKDKAWKLQLKAWLALEIQGEVEEE